MGDALVTTVASSYPIVVSSTTPKEIEQTYPDHSCQYESRQGLDNSSPNPSESQNPTREVQTQFNLQSPSLPREDHSNSQNLSPEGPRTMPTDFPHIHGLPEMTDPPYPESSTQSHFRYPLGVPSHMVTTGFTSPNIQGIAQPANTIYYPFPNNRYSPVYYNSYVPQYAPQTIPVAQVPVQPGTYFYTPGYPHSYPQTPTVVTGAPPNTSRYLSQLHSTPPRWSPGQQPVSHYVYMTNPFVTQSTPPPMQQSFSHPVQNIQQLQQPPPLLPNSRRHSHPVKSTFTRVKSNDSEPWQNSRWGGQVVSTNLQSAPGGLSSANANSTTNMRSSISPSIQNNPSSFSPHTDGSPSIQPVETPPSILTTVNAGTHPALPRGPPRKPKQSGHALWVGNLPPGTNVIDLKDHFSSGATSQIESVFLISKSNCAFINYKTDSACNEAMARFHDNKFKGVRLVCRLRRHSSASPTATTTSKEKSQNPQDSPDTQLLVDGAGNSERITNGVDGEEPKAKSPDLEGKEDKSREHLKDRIFILKSLTVEDLDLSVKNSVWATQTHNEEVLNRAFETCENVYLIFSANKSGEYYGYAKMTSRIPEKDVDENEGRTNSDTPVGVHRMGGVGGSLPEALLPKAIYTPPTATAPEGRIIDDSARGTIFWEATEEEVTEGDPKDNLDRPDLDLDELVSATKSWGKPFNVQWISTTKLPFYRTRGLRNSWNSNREVKIARDGTEVEPGIGKRLLQMFHQRVVGNAPPQS